MKITKLGLSAEQIAQHEKLGIRYSKIEKKKLVEMSNTQAPTKDELIEILSIVNYQIPEDYFSFLMKHNGGRPDPCTISTQEDNYVIDLFLSAKAPNGYYDSITNTMAVFNGSLPNHSLPIARSPGGDLILLDLSKEKSGEISCWRHDHPENTSTIVIADSFTDLLSKLSG
jgi:hypothetical protein